MNTPRTIGASGRLFQGGPLSQAGNMKIRKHRRGRGSGTAVSQRTAPPHPCKPLVHPMNALALAQAFHPRAPGGGAGVFRNENGGGGGGGGVGGVDYRGVNKSPGMRKGFISSLGLPFARLHPRSVEEIAAHAISSLTHLDLSHCHVGPAGACALARALDAGRTVGVNGSGGNNSSSRGRGSRSLRSLQLLHNAIGDSGARALGHALATNRCLTSLSLASNNIRTAGGRALAAAFTGNNVVLTRLDIGDNPLGDESARMLIEAAAASMTAAAATVAAAVSAGGGGGDSDHDGRVATVQILGLDRVAGVTVATRETARRVLKAVVRSESNVEGVRMRRGMADEVCEGQCGAATALLSASEKVLVEPEDPTINGGFVQVIV